MNKQEKAKESLEDCASPIRCSACGGLLPLEGKGRIGGEREGERRRRDEEEGKRGKRHIVNHGPVAPMYYIL